MLHLPVAQIPLLSGFPRSPALRCRLSVNYSTPRLAL
jgi:hypothetical protein